MTDTVRVTNLFAGAQSIDAKFDEDRVVRHRFALQNEVLVLDGIATLDEAKRNAQLAAAEAAGRIRIEGAADGPGELAEPFAGQAPLTSATIDAKGETFLRIDASNNPITVNLPPAASNYDAVIKVKNQSDSDFVVSVVPAGTDTVHGAPMFQARGRFGLQLRSDGISDWMIH